MMLACGLHSKNPPNPVTTTNNSTYITSVVIEEKEKQTGTIVFVLQVY